jgi:tetratricopeptide (TPR) repeat protein
MLGEHERAETARQHALQIPATTTRDHYLLATALARQGTPEATTEAIAELNQALRTNPRDYWSSVQQGICQLQLGNFVAAAGDFGNCIGLWPEFPWSYFNRGCALDRGGRKAEAIDDYSEALQRDPGFIPAHVNRGLALLELKRHSAALADFESAREQGGDEPSIDVGRAIALEGLGRSQEADASFQAAMAHADALSESARLRLIWTYGFAVADHRPSKAKEMFDAVLRRDSRQPQALYGLAMLAMSQGRNEEALRSFDRALEASPGLVEVRRYRAVLRARIGDWARAEDDINRCLERDSNDGSTLYVAACVASLASRSLSSVKAADQAIELLEKAVAHGVDPAKAVNDSDMVALQEHPRFKRLLAGRSSR